MIECDNCGSAHHQCTRGSASEANMFRVMNAVVKGNTPKLFYCDEWCYQEHAAKDFRKLRARRQVAVKRSVTANELVDEDTSDSE